MLGLTAPQITYPGEINTLAIDDLVGASATVDVDTILYSTLCSATYHMCVYNVTEDKWRTFTLHASKITGGDVEDSMYAINGDQIDFDVSFLVVATNAVLRITNNETYALTVEGVRVR